MANPSLQIGNSKWAIKKDNLLGYSSSGTRFFPIPITMTRASAGTRVNSSGLVETVELLGSDDVTDGNFPSGTTAWSFGTGWSLGTNKAERLVAASSTDLVQASVFPNLTSTFQISFDVEASAGSVRARLGQTNLAYVGQGSYVLYGVPTGNDQLKFQADSSFVGSITNISVKEYQANDLARVDYTGSTSSLLAEPQRTNLFIQNDYSTWNGFGSYSSNTTLSPDGSTINFINFEDLRIYPTTTISSSTEYSTSIYIKANKTADVKLRSAAAGDTVISLTTEWQRFDLTATSSSTTSNALLIDGRFSQSMGASGLEIAIYGGQIEAGSYATSYIPTSGSTVTRVQDQYSKTGISDKINSEQGVLFVEMAALSDDLTRRKITISDGTLSNFCSLYFDSVSNRIIGRTTVGGVLQSFLITSSYTEINFNKIAFKWKENDFSLWVNGTEVAVDTSGVVWSSGVLTKISFDNGVGAENLFGKVKQLQVFKTALTDSELATLTTI